MKVELELGLRDVPGSLISALQPISDSGGNISSVVHMRGIGELVGVKVVFKIRDVESLERIKQLLVKSRVHVSKIRVEGRKYFSKRTLSFLFVGHVIDTDIQDTIDRMNDVGLVSDISVSMSDPQDKSSVIMLVEFDGRSYKRLLEVVDCICRKKDLMVVTSIDGE